MAARCGPPFFAVVFFAERVLYRRLEGGVLYRKWRGKFFYAGRHCIVRI